MSKLIPRVIALLDQNNFLLYLDSYILVFVFEYQIVLQH